MPYILIGTFNGEVDYGVDSNSYIMGVYRELADAEEDKARKEVSETPVNVYDMQCRKRLFLIKNFYGLIETTENFYPQDNMQKVKYCDGTYEILEFKGLPIRCGGAYYEE